MDFFSKSPETIVKRMVLTSKEDYDEVLAEIKKVEQKNFEKTGSYYSEILEANESPSFHIILKETFKDSICPRCHCRTIGNVLVPKPDYPRETMFVDECNGCNLRFTIHVDARNN